MSAALPLLSPLVTRILELSGFPPELKTRDIQAIFSPWEDDRGGFRIKWVDDITALIIFADALTAKKAYLQTLMSPPPSLLTSSGVFAKLRPYDGDDAGSVIASVQNRPRSRSNAGGAQATSGHAFSTNEDTTAPQPSTRAGLSGSPRGVGRNLMSGHRRSPSGSNPSSLPPKPLAAALFDAANGGPSPAHHLANAVAAEAAAAAAAAGESQEDDQKGLNNTALKDLPVNPMSTPRTSEGLKLNALELNPSTDLKKTTNSSKGPNGTAATEVVST